MLLAYGIAGPRTLAALGLVGAATLPSAIPRFTPEKTCVMPEDWSMGTRTAWRASRIAGSAVSHC